MRLVWIILVGSLGWAAPQTGELPRWVLDLARIKRHLRPNFMRLPNYICLETIHRFHSTRKNPEFRPLDIIRLEVAQVGGQELFAREGAGQFKEMDLSQLISQGSIGNGDFAGTTRNLFVHDAARTTGFGEETDGGKRLLRYDFEIPQMLGPRKLTSGGVSAWVGEKGSFWVDAETLDLLEIQDDATDIPPELGIMEATTNIKYTGVRIGDSEVLLPATAETVMTRYDGTRDRNLTEFSACRAYVTESKISFGPAFVSDSKVTYGGEPRKGTPAGKK